MANCKVCNIDVANYVQNVICLECLKKGYSFCEICHNTYQTKNIDYNEFHILKPDDVPNTSLTQGVIKHFNDLIKSVYTRHFCSEKCVNLYIWQGVQNEYINALHHEKIIGIRKLLKPLPGGKNLPEIPDNELNIISNYVEEKIEKIKKQSAKE